jgi:hypothetical protein
MNTQIKNKLIKLFLIFFLVFMFLFIFDRSLEAKYVKKLTIENFSDPVDWENALKPGAIFSTMLENSLADSGIFQMMQIKKIKLNKNKIKKNNKSEDSENGTKNKEPEMDVQQNVTNLSSVTSSPLSQYKIHGSFIQFVSDTNPLNNGNSDKERKFHKERAIIQAKIELLNLHTGRSLAKKTFTTRSDDGKKIFNLNSPDIDYKSDKFKSYSIGKALWILNNQVQMFIYNILSEVPLEGDLIWVDHDTNSAIINLGKANGIEIRDVFTVFSVKPLFNDPVDKVDLGDMYTRKGTIKISEVQGRFSKAKIVSGAAFAPGDLVVPKNSNPKKLLEPTKKTPRTKRYSHPDKKEKLLQKDITWGAYKGLPSLSY